MAWNGLVLTAEGQNVLNSAQLANKMNIKSIVVGDGRPPANFRTLKGLVHQLYEIENLKIEVAEGGKCTLTVDIPQVEYDYYFRELGVIVDTDQGEKLYVYDNCGDDAQFIVSTTGVENTRKRIRLTLNIADVENIVVANPSIMYVAYDDFETAVENLEQAIEGSDVKQQEAIEAAKKLLADMINDHIGNKENPHDVDAVQLGLDQVNNTSDRDKPVSTAQQAALDALYEQLTAYVRQKIAELINGADTSMDTLKEVADVIAAHKTVMDALDAAIGKKANQAEMDSLLNTKLDKTGDASNVTTAFSQASSRANLTAKEKLSVSMGKIMKWLADLANGAASTLLGTNLTASRALVSDSSGKVGVSAATSTELGYLSGVKSKIQTQIDKLNTGLSGKANSGHTHDDRYYTESEINTLFCSIGSLRDNAGGIVLVESINFLGYGFSLYGRVLAYDVGMHTYIVRVQGKVIATSGNASSNDFAWGLNLTAILDYSKMDVALQYKSGLYSVYNSAGALIMDGVAFGTGFGESRLGGYRVLTPGRYYNTNGQFGLWPSNHAVAQTGAFYDVTIVVYDPNWISLF